MENSKKNNDFYTGEPQVLRKAEIARILNTVKQAPFNADNSNNSNDKAFKKRSLLDIALNAAKDENLDEVIEKDSEQEQKDHENISIDNERALETNNETINQNNFDEDDKRQLIEENEALIEERIKKAENDAFLKGKETGLEEGKLQGISEARAQSQEGLDAAISIFRIAAETIDNSDQSNLDILNDMIQKSVLTIAQESAGFIIDTLPEKFVSRINELSKLINENIKKISLDMNCEDYEIIKEFIEKDEFLSAINIKQNKDLLRGNMKLNADGIKVDDFFSYHASDILSDQQKLNTDTLSKSLTEDQHTDKSETAETENIPEQPTDDQEITKVETSTTETATENITEDQHTDKSETAETENIPEQPTDDQEITKVETSTTETATENITEDQHTDKSETAETENIINQNTNKENE